MTQSYRSPADLLQCARRGNVVALGKLLDHYRNYLRVLARLRLGTRLRTKLDCSDVVQETCLKACEKFGQFRGQTEEELSAWLRQILATTLANMIRHHHAGRRDLRLEEKLAEELNASSQALGQVISGKEKSPSQQAGRREQVVLLANALESLPEHYRQVLLLRHLKGQSFPQIAREMKRTVGSVEKLWVRALASLRETLGETP